MRIVLLACLIAPSVALADPIWCGTSLNQNQLMPRYDWGTQLRPSLTQQLAIRYVTVDQIQDSRAHAVIESMLTPCPTTGAWDVTLIVGPDGAVLAVAATGIRDGTCIADQLRLARFEHAPELRTVSARIASSLVPQMR